MKEPTTEAEVKALHAIRRTDPQRYLAVVDDWIRENPENDRAYSDRHFGWMDQGEPRRALADMDKVVELNPDPFNFFLRGVVYRHLGEYDKALADFACSERKLKDEWDDFGFGLLHQADCHARLGELDKAIACCDRLPEDFWTPGIDQAPAGDKRAVAEKLRAVAAEARRDRRQTAAANVNARRE